MPAKSPQNDRKARLAAALRENLKRRKAQARERGPSAASDIPPGPRSHDRAEDRAAASGGENRDRPGSEA